jgi:thioredoxin reductase (NADPH)
MLDLVIIGAGPAGLAAARDAMARGLDFVVLERGLIGDTIHQYPIGKPLFSTPAEIELSPGGLRIRAEKPTREELLTHYTRFVVERALPVHTAEEVVSLERGAESFAVTTRNAVYTARTVLVATGINGFRKHLGVPGETPERVHYRFVEAFPYANKRVLVTGSGNSAAEVTLFLEEVAQHVTLVMRRPDFGDDPRTGKPGIKWWVREPLDAVIAAGRVDVFFDSCVVAVSDTYATVESAARGRVDVPCEAVFAMLGTRPDLHLLAEAGVVIDEDGVPCYNPDTFETNVPGLFVAGHITRERHIKGALAVAPRVVEHIAESLALEKPVA